jgi:predicted NUDIX family NTP pyrophosphohydrolase
MGGKIVYAWTVRCDMDPAGVKSNTFLMEWPRGSGRMREFPEIDRAEWFKIDMGKRKILKSQSGLLDQLEKVAVSRGEVERLKPLLRDFYYKTA